MLSESILAPIIANLPIFLEAARSGSFTKASKVLEISQPSVSRSILVLEKYLGILLFERSQNRLVLTAEGHKLYLATSNGFNHIESILTAIKPKTSGSKVFMGCPSQLIPWLTSRVPLLSHILGDVEIELVAIESRKPNNHEGVDIAIQFGSGNWQGYESKLLIKEEIFPVCAPLLEKKFNWLGKDLTPLNLTGLPLIPGNRNEVGYLGWDKWFAYFNVKFHPFTQYNDFTYSYHLNIELAILGKGIILAWRGTVESQINNGQLIELPSMRLNGLNGLNGFYLVYPVDSPFAYAARKWAESMRVESNCR